jgi:hypothetical protein
MGLARWCVPWGSVRDLADRVQSRLIDRSYQLQADVPTGGTTSGALVHFTEDTMGPNVSTTTPWIAYISCDANETDASQNDG